MKITELVEAAAREAKKYMPTNMRTKGSGIKWLCCSEPFKERTRKGKTVWMASCQYKKGQVTGSMRRIVGRPKKKDPKGQPILGPKPMQILFGGKPIKRCPR